jgi:DNA-binding NtrC family response regulator
MRPAIEAVLEPQGGDSTAGFTSHRLAFCEDRLPDGDYTDFLSVVRSSGWPIPVVVCSRQPNLSLYLDAMVMGAYDFMVPPYEKADVAWIAEGARWIERMRSERPPARGRVGRRPYEH